MAYVSRRRKNNIQWTRLYKVDFNAMQLSWLGMSLRKIKSNRKNC